MTPLMAAAKNDHNPKKTSLLLKAGAKVNEVDDWDYTPLHFAARNNPNPEILATLLDGGADPDATTCDNESTPMELAAKFNSAICKSPHFKKLMESTGAAAEILECLEDGGFDVASICEGAALAEPVKEAE
jgi:ankyrin repeat protein